MDAHTARCLQLSSSIQPHYSQAAAAGPYRHNRFESMNRSSRYNPQQMMQQQRMPQRANSMPAVSRFPQPQQQQPAAFKRNFQNPMMNGAHGYAAQPMSQNPSEMSPGSQYDGSVFSGASSTLSPETPFGNEGQWDPTFGIDMKQMQKAQDSLGMSFLDQEFDFTAPYGMTSTDGLDLIHLNENDHQMMPQKPMSPDRHSLSSNSSGDNYAEFPEATGVEHNGMHILAQDIPMATVEEEEPMGDFRGSARQQSHSRSNSRAPAARASSTRRYRRAPYSFDGARFEGHRRSSSVMSAASSVGSVAPMSMPPTQCCSPVNECNDDFGLTDFSQLDFGSQRASVDQDLFAMDPLHAMPHGAFQTDLIAPQPKYMADQMFLHNGFEEHLFDATAPMLPSSHLPNDHTLAAQVDEFAEYAEEPDLFGALSEEPCLPSEEDMNPEDESMKPQEQEVRFEGDLYTPRFVRGTGVNREGFCGLCKPGGRWLVLKNSAYWYDKSFTHGISAATGQPFEGPKETRRMNGNPDVWEGLCGCCNEWIALISNKKKGTTWFRHAYKCHNKNKDSKKKNANKKKGDDKESSVEPMMHPEQLLQQPLQMSPQQQHHHLMQQQMHQQQQQQQHAPVYMLGQPPHHMQPQQQMHPMHSMDSFLM